MKLKNTTIEALAELAKSNMKEAGKNCVTVAAEAGVSESTVKNAFLINALPLPVRPVTYTKIMDCVGLYVEVVYSPNKVSYFYRDKA